MTKCTLPHIVLTQKWRKRMQHSQTTVKKEQKPESNRNMKVIGKGEDAEVHAETKQSEDVTEGACTVDECKTSKCLERNGPQTGNVSKENENDSCSEVYVGVASDNHFSGDIERVRNFNEHSDIDTCYSEEDGSGDHVVISGGVKKEQLTNKTEKFNDLDTVQIEVSEKDTETLIGSVIINNKGKLAEMLNHDYTRSSLELSARVSSQHTANSSPEVKTKSPECSAKSSPELNTKSSPEFNAESSAELNTKSFPELNTKSSPKLDTKSSQELNSESSLGLNTMSTTELNTKSAEVDEENCYLNKKGQLTDHLSNQQKRKNKNETLQLTGKLYTTVESTTLGRVRKVKKYGSFSKVKEDSFAIGKMKHLEIGKEESLETGKEESLEMPVGLVESLEIGQESLEMGKEENFEMGEQNLEIGKKESLALTGKAETSDTNAEVKQGSSEQNGIDVEKRKVQVRSSNPRKRSRKLKLKIMAKDKSLSDACEMPDTSVIFKSENSQHEDPEKMRASVKADGTQVDVTGKKKYKESNTSLVHGKVCEICGETFQTHKRWDYHRRYKHNKTKYHKCEICSYSTPYFSTYKRHQDMHMNRQKKMQGVSEEIISAHMCDQCGKCFTARGNLLTHVRAHINPPSYKCIVCGKTFSQKGNLKTHQQRHEKEKEKKQRIDDGDVDYPRKSYPCRHCDKIFRWKGDRCRHIKTIHYGIKNFSCSQCGKSFVDITALKKHQFIHTGTKPFHCVQCDKAYISKHNLEQHVYNRHQNQ